LSFELIRHACGRTCTHDSPKTPDLQSGAFAAQPRMPKICYDKKRRGQEINVAGHTSARTSPRGGLDCWTLAKHTVGHPRRHPCPRLFTQGTSVAKKLKERAFSASHGSRPAPSILAFLLGILGAGAAPAFVTDAIDAGRKSVRLPLLRVYYQARQPLMIGLWNSDNRQTRADRHAWRQTTRGRVRPCRASCLVLSGSSSLKFRSPHTR
jgi:hypothetical protein